MTVAVLSAGVRTLATGTSAESAAAGAQVVTDSDRAGLVRLPDDAWLTLLSGSGFVPGCRVSRAWPGAASADWWAVAAKGAKSQRTLAA